MAKPIRKRSIARHDPPQPKAEPAPALQLSRTSSHAIDAVWQAQIRARMRELGVSQAELARRIGASDAAIVLIFKSTTTGSCLVARIHAALDLAPPIPTRATAAWATTADGGAQSAALRGTGGQG